MADQSAGTSYRRLAIYMCGIAGIYAYHCASSRVDRAELVRMRDHMRARGPDGQGEWYSDDGHVGFAHRRLAIIDLSDAGAQPMVSGDGKYIITFNGEIYNHLALRADLERKGSHFRSQSDTEVLLHLYAERGADMVRELRGMYAFAIWDLEAETLFLARDPLGIKPLYTANDGRTFRFASQVKSLLRGAVSRAPEPAGIVGFHLWGSVPEPFTFYREIRALPAGHIQWVDRIGPRAPEAFANIAAVLGEGARKRVLQSEFHERVRQGTFESVKAHLLADVEVGLFLSAGVDSGALLGLMRDAGARDIRGITLGFEEFEGTPEDETLLAAEVALHYGACHVVRRVGEKEFREDLPALFEAMDQPSIDGVNTWFVSKAAKEAGLKVALSGLGGDELLAGYPSFTDLPRWRRRFGALASIPGVAQIVRATLEIVAPGFCRKRPKALGVLQYANSWPGVYLLRRGLYLPHEIESIMDPDWAREGLRRLKVFGQLSRSLEPDPGSDIGRVAVLEASHYMRNQLLRDADWAGMAHGVEIRVPLVDWTLLQQLAPIVPDLAPGTGKLALANAPKHPLNDNVLRRAKTGFGVPTAAWMDASGGMGGSRTLRTAKGVASRDWSQVVLNRALVPLPAIGSPN